MYSAGFGFQLVSDNVCGIYAIDVLEGDFFYV